MKDGKYSPYIGELLKQKRDEGVVVNLLTSSTCVLYMDGGIGTHDNKSWKILQRYKSHFQACFDGWR